MNVKTETPEEAEVFNKMKPYEYNAHVSDAKKSLTAKEFVDLGLVFANGDKCEAFGQEFEFLGNKISEQFYDAIVTSFAWRPLNTLPDNPKFEWESTFVEEYLSRRWRPMVNQSVPLRVGVMSNGEEVGLVAANDDKPAFTQAAADAGELPPVGELVQIRRFLSGDNEFYNGRVVASNAKTVWFCCDKYGDRLYHKEEIELRPVDTRTHKQKAVDAICESVGYSHNKFAVEIVSDLYDCGFIKTDKEV